MFLGEMSVMYLFVRYKFHWNEKDFSIFNAYQMTIVLLGKLQINCIILFFIFCRIFKITFVI